jgi:hypothetical protein
VLHASHSSAVTDLVTAIRTYHDSISDATRALFHPLPSLTLSTTPAQSAKAHELLGSLITSLDLLAQDSWALPVCIPQPETESSVIPQILRLAPEDRMDVPSVLVPPEVEGEERVGEETGIEWWIRMYDDEVRRLIPVQESTELTFGFSSLLHLRHRWATFCEHCLLI